MFWCRGICRTLLVTTFNIFGSGSSDSSSAEDFVVGDEEEAFFVLPAADAFAASLDEAVGGEAVVAGFGGVAFFGPAACFWPFGVAATLGAVVGIIFFGLPFASTCGCLYAYLFRVSKIVLEELDKQLHRMYRVYL